MEYSPNGPRGHNHRCEYSGISEYRIPNQASGYKPGWYILFRVDRSRERTGAMGLDAVSKRPASKNGTRDYEREPPGTKMMTDAKIKIMAAVQERISKNKDWRLMADSEREIKEIKYFIDEILNALGEKFEPYEKRTSTKAQKSGRR